MKCNEMCFPVGACLLLGCSATGEGQGRLRVLLEAESTISEGLLAGEGEEDVRDGWSVHYERYLGSIGVVTVKDAVDADETRSAPDNFVVDLVRVPESGTTLWELDGLHVGRWSFGYAVGFQTNLQRHESVERKAFDAFVDSGHAFRVSGYLEKPDGVSCPPPALASMGVRPSVGVNGGGVACYSAPVIAFDLSLGVPVKVGPCERDGSEGFAIGDGATTTVAITIHGDHVFFNGFPESAEGRVLRLAQWFADSDLNLDGEVTTLELDAIALSDLWELDLERYQFGGSPLTPLDTLRTYVEAQLSTQGHFQGEGECALSVPAD